MDGALSANEGASAAPEPKAHDDLEKPLLMHVDPCYPITTVWDDVCSVPRLAFRWHPLGVLFSIVSSFLCWLSGNSAERSVDPLMFKSILVVFGLTLGFRLVRANTRSAEAQAATKQLLHSAMSMLVLLPQASRQSCGEDLHYLLEAFSSHLLLVAHRRMYWYNMVSLHPACTLETRPSSLKLSLGTAGHQEAAFLSPRTLMVALMCQIGEACLLHHKTRSTEWVWRQVEASFMAAYDKMEILAIPSVCDTYVHIIGIVLAAFAICLPWGIAISPFDIPTGLTAVPALHFSSGVLLTLNTLLISATLFGLNGLAQETEDPFDCHGPDDIDVRRIVKIFEVKLKKYNVRFDESVQQMRCYGSMSDVQSTSNVLDADVATMGSPANLDDLSWEERVQIHKNMCPPPLDEEKGGHIFHTMLSSRRISR